MIKRKINLLMLFIIVLSLSFIIVYSDEGVYYPVVHTNQTTIHPSIVFYTGYYGTNFYLRVNSTDYDNNTRTLNLTLTAPNGTNVMYRVNSTSRVGDYWNTTNYTINQYGEWTYVITATDNDFLSNYSTGVIRIMQINFSVNKTLADNTSPIYINGRIINGTRQGAENATYSIYLNNTLLWSNITDTEGYYNITLNATAHLGIHNLLINSSYNNEYSETNVSLEIQDLPNINSYRTDPGALYYLGRDPINFTLTANATDPDLYSVNFTLIAPNGTYLINNVNATSSIDDWFNSTKITLDQYGQWNYSIIAWDTDGYNDTVYGFVKLLQITENLNTSIADENHKVRISGHINDENGDDLENTALCIWLNNSFAEPLYNCRDEWWNTLWVYRKNISIENSRSATVNNSIGLVNFSTLSLISENKMNSDCGDIRFTTNNNEELEYTLETSTCDSANTLFWVWGNFTKEANTTIWAYYGNSQASLKTNYTNPDSNLKVYMHFDRSVEYGETTSKFFDFSKSGLNGTCLTCPSLITGKYGRAASFNGINDHINLTEENDSLSTHIFTIMAWIYREEDTGDIEFIVDNRNASTTGFGLYVASDDLLKLRVGTVISESTSVPIETGRWYHVAATAGGSQQRLYIDGVVVNNSDQDGPVSESADMIIGMKSFEKEYFWNGIIDELRIYDRRLTLDEVKAVYSATKPFFEENETLVKTDSNGDYDIQITAPNVDGVYVVKINSSTNGAYGEQTSSLRVMPFPIINNYGTIPYPVIYNGDYGSLFYISLNITDDDSNILSVNYTLTAPNGSIIYNNINATEHEGDIWNTSYYTADQYGQWNYTIRAWDSLNGSYEISDVIKYLQITLNMNETIAEQNNSIRIYGYAYDSDGIILINNSLYFYLDDVLLNFTDGWNFNNPAYWWNISWKERTPLSLRLNSTINVDNMLAHVNFSTSTLIAEGKMKSDCSDVRFADWDGNLLNFTLEESTCDSADTLFWVWVDLEGNVNKTIYAYYGNPNALPYLNYSNPDNTLKLYMHFDQTSMYDESSSHVFDFSKNNNNGTITSLTQSSDCVFGKCYEFNANGDKILVDDRDSLTFGQGTSDLPFTIMTWIYMEDATNFPIVNKVFDSEHAEYGLYTNASGMLYLSLYDNEIGLSTYAATNLSLISYQDQWIHITATYNASNEHNGTSLYINGILQNTTKGNISDYIAMHNEDNDLYIGYDEISGLSSQGKFDELRIYNRSLSQNEVIAHYETTKTSMLATTSFTQTDSSGFYNYTFNAPDVYDDFEIKINATHDLVYGMTNTTLRVVEGGNSVPEITFLNITPALPNSTSNIQCKIIVDDAETELLTVEYWWLNQTSGSEVYHNGTMQVSKGVLTTLSTIVYQTTTLDEAWNCTAKVYDNSKYSENSSVSTTIYNIPPSQTSFSLTPTYPNTTSDLSCYANYTDELNSTFQIEWFWNNLTSSGYETVLSGNTTMSNGTDTLITKLGSGNTTTGETWNCSIRAYDGYNNSLYISSVRTINTIPELNLTALPSLINETSNINCEVLGLDEENETLRVEYWWYNLTDSGYETVISGNATIDSAINNMTNITLGSGNTTKGETWNCTVILHDGTNHTNYMSTITKINNLPNITNINLNADTNSNLNCYATVVDPENTSINVEWSWYNLTGSGYEIIFNGTTNIENNSNTLITTLTSANTTNDEIWNCSIRAYDGYGYSNYSSSSRLVDKNLPYINLNYPNISSILTTQRIEINYTLNESNINHTWYVHDYNDTKINLTYTEEEGFNLFNISFNYPGKHTISIYVNDTFGNIASDSLTFYINDLINVSKWIFNYNDSQSNVSSVIISNRTNPIITGNTTVKQNLTLEINLSDIKIFIYNISAEKTRWEYFFDIYSNNSYFESQINTNYGTEAVDYVYIKNFSKFYDNTSEYFSKIVLPMNMSHYSSVYYCPGDDLTSCTKLSSCGTNYSDTNLTACYNNTLNNVNVFAPSLGSVFADNDTIAPIITITNPINGSNTTESYNQNLSFTTNEEATCRYSFDETLYANLGSAESFAVYFNYTQNMYKNITIICYDSSSNYANSTIFYRVNDTSYPAISSFDEDTDTTSLEFTFNTDEPANCTYMLIGEETKKSSSFLLSHSYTFTTLSADTSYDYNITVCDRIGNCHTSTGTESTDSDLNSSSSGGSSSGGSSGSGSTVNDVVNHIFFSLSEGEHYINIASTDIAITKLIFTMKNVVNGSILFTIQSKDLPSNYPGLTDNYQYISIDKSRITDADIESAKIRFRVENDWIEDNNIDPDTISMYRYTTKWVKLNTEKTSADSVYSYYEANSPGFSYFGIKGDKYIEETDNGETESNIDVNIIDDDTDDPSGDQQDDTQQTISDDTNTSNNIMTFILIGIITIIIVLIGGVVVVVQQKNNNKINDDLKTSSSQSLSSLDSSIPGQPQQIMPGYGEATQDELKEIEDYVLLCRSQGIEESSIRSVLLETGWQENTVDMVMSKVSMPDDELQLIITYINTLRQNNISDEEIIQNLRQAGWQEFAINEAFKRV